MHIDSNDGSEEIPEILAVILRIVRGTAVSDA